MIKVTSRNIQYSMPRHVGNDIDRVSLIVLAMVRSPMNYNTSSTPRQVAYGLVVTGGSVPVDVPFETMV
jgi:hypothetical protein